MLKVALLLLLVLALLPLSTFAGKNKFSLHRCLRGCDMMAIDYKKQRCRQQCQQRHDYDQNRYDKKIKKGWITIPAM